MKRSVSIILLLLILFCMSACSKKENGEDKFEELLLNTQAPEENYENFAELIYLIISDSASSELAVRAQDLADKIGEKTGIRTLLKYDSEAVSVGEDILEILVGNSSRLIAKETFKRLRDGDYVCRYDRGVIVLGGKDDAATLRAIEKFENDILPGASQASIMSVDAHFEVSERTDCIDLMLNGFYIYDYKISFGGSELAKEAAKIIRDVILKISGYSLTVEEISKKDGEEKAICVCVDRELKEGEATVRTLDGNIEIFARDDYGLSLAVAEFVSCMSEEHEDSCVRIDVLEDLNIEYDAKLFDVEVALLNSNDVTLDMALEAAKIMNTSKALAICFGEVSREFLDDIRINLPKTHGLEFIELDDKLFSLVYNKERAEKVEIRENSGVVEIKLHTDNFGEWRFVVPALADAEISLDEQSIAVVKEDTGSELLNIGKFSALGGDFFVLANDGSGLGANISEATYKKYFEVRNIGLFEKLCKEYLKLKNTVEG